MKRVSNSLLVVPLSAQPGCSGYLVNQRTLDSYSSTLGSVDWNSVIHGSVLDLDFSCFYSKLIDNFITYFPKITHRNVCNGNRTKMWISPDLIASTHEKKKRLLRHFKRCLTEHNGRIYQTFCNNFSTQLWHAKHAHMHAKLSLSAKSKNQWNIINEFNGCKVSVKVGVSYHASASE